jgi:hypothetical protein
MSSGSSNSPSVGRRSFLVASTVGFAGMQFGRPGLVGPSTAAAKMPSAGPAPRAKSTILFFLCGGSSHIDMWDLKPDAPLEIRGEYNPIDTSAPGVQICEHLPLTAKQAHHFSIVRSLRGTVNTNDHHAGYYYNLTGHAADPSFVSLGNNRTPMADDWPYMGCVVGSRVPSRGGLPGAVSLPYMPSRLPYTRPGQFAARLGIEHDPLYVLGSHEKPLHFEAPALTLSGDVTAARLSARDGLLATMNDARRRVDAVADVQKWSGLQERAMTLLGSAETTAAFNVADEPEAVRAKYGTSVNGMSLLVARRLVEAGVPFITVFWLVDEKIGAKCASAGSWDTHSNNFNCLKQDLLPVFDRGYSALLGDLSERGLLDSTLVVVTSEMGRTPKVGGTRTVGSKTPGRDHWTHCQSVILAGGGIQGGQVYGSSDKEAGYPKDKPVTPSHIVKTVYRQMGVHDLEAKDPDGRVFNLMAEGEPLTALL